MTVYVLMNYHGDRYEGDTNLIAVYSTLFKAKIAKRKEELAGDEYDQFWIEKEEVQ